MYNEPVKASTSIPGAKVLKYILDQGGRNVPIANISRDTGIDSKDVMSYLESFEMIKYVHFGWTPVEIRGRPGFKKIDEVSLDSEKMNVLLKLNKS